MKIYIRCFDCGELKEAYEIIKENITIYKCDCKECGSITTSTDIEYFTDCKETSNEKHRAHKSKK